MFFIFGTNGNIVEKKTINNYNCKDCNCKTNSLIVVKSEYLHIFWIPIFPTGKTVSTKCANCKIIYQNDEIPFELKEDTRKIKESAETPFFYWSGLFTAIFFFVFLYILPLFHIVDSNPQRRRISLNEGDCFLFRIKDEYSLRKIKKIEGDSIFFLNQTILSKDIKKLKQNNKPEFYLDKNLVLKQSEFYDMLGKNIKTL